MKAISKKNAVAKVSSGLLVLCVGLAVVGVMSFKPTENPILILKINNVDKNGKLFISFCSSPSEWTDKGKFAFIFEAINGKPNVFKINTLPEGNYSVAVFLDVNRNGKLDINFLGIPKEPYGFSNNPSSRFSKPSFKECNFSFNQTMQWVEINL